MAPPTRRKSPTPCIGGHLITEPEDVWNSPKAADLGDAAKSSAIRGTPVVMPT
jgi:hypothetical protein